eukprot:2171651-Rhodomonas_salina.1
MRVSFCSSEPRLNTTIAVTKASKALPRLGAWDAPLPHTRACSKSTATKTPQTRGTARAQMLSRALEMFGARAERFEPAAESESCMRAPGLTFSGFSPGHTPIFRRHPASPAWHPICN